MNNKIEQATLGGGCFWCLEAIYIDLEGILKVDPGYSGGNLPDPDYQSICKGNTGHAEVVQLTFDPGIISYKEILEIFFGFHDPTTPDRQGADVGSHYRSIIFTHSDSQNATAQETIEQINNSGIWSNPIVTEVTALRAFYPAEDYHREYFKRNPNQGYCQVVISPKVAKFRKKYADRLKSASRHNI